MESSEKEVIKVEMNKLANKNHRFDKELRRLFDFFLQNHNNISTLWYRK